MSIETRLAAIEALITAAPPAVSVETLLERVRLGEAATKELTRALSPWKEEQSQSQPTRFHRQSVNGRNHYVVHVPHGETVYHISSDSYANPKIATRIDCDPADSARVMELADMIFAIAGFRLEK